MYRVTFEAPCIKTLQTHNVGLSNGVNILTLILHSERSSRVLHHGNPKIWFSVQKRLKLNFDLQVLKCWNHPSFVNISPSVKNNKKGFHDYYFMGTQKIWFYLEKKKHAYLNVTAVMFCKQFSAYTVHIDMCYLTIYKHSSS